MEAATDKTEVPVWEGESSRGSWKQKVQMGSKLHSGNTAKENTDSNRTGMALRWVGVRSDVHRRQQAPLAVYRKNCQQAKIWTFDPASAKKKKTAAAATEKAEAAAAAAKVEELTAAIAAEKNKTEAADAEEDKAATAASDVFCLIAAAAEADTVARTAARAAARAEAATDIQSVVRAGQRHQVYDKLQRREAAYREEKAAKVGRLEAVRDAAEKNKTEAVKELEEAKECVSRSAACTRFVGARSDRVESAAAQLDAADKEHQKIVRELRCLEAMKEDDAATILWSIRQRILRNS